MICLDDFVTKTLKLIELERDTEKEEKRASLENESPKELQKRGLCLLNMRINGQRSGMFGRTLFMFESFYVSKDIPSHSLTPGDIVGVSEKSENLASLTSGIVSHVRKTSITLAVDDTDDVDLDTDKKYQLVKLANDVTYKRLRRAIQDLRNFQTGPAGNLIDVLFGESDLRPSLRIPSEFEFYNRDLDESQREAVKFALAQPEIAVIHGPPGTGKTTTVVEIVRQAVKQGLKVLATAPSNIAVDNLVERLAAGNVKVVRLGHPARALRTIQKYSLDAILSYSDETKLVKDVRKDINDALSKMRKIRDKGERQSLKGDLKFLRKELRQREDAATRDILMRAEVVLSTLTSTSRDGPIKLLEPGHFDIVVIDECSQAIEAACWIPLMRVPRCVLAGDHQQLPPTIISKEAAQDGLEVTLMERQLSNYGDRIMRMLTTQYRMHTLIMQWSSDQLYKGKLRAHPSVASHLLKDIDGVDDTENTSIPLLIIDTAGCDLYELDTCDNVSKGNEGEVDLVSVHVECLISAGVRQEDIAVIAPYNLQVELLRLKMSEIYPKLEIKSVDSFQGREKEAVVISLVRSNSQGEVGFLAEDRRINVAITRARRHLAVICDSDTVSKHKFLESLVDYMTTNGEVRSAHQYQIDNNIGKCGDRPAFVSKKLNTKIQDGGKPSNKDKLDRKDTSRLEKLLNEFLMNSSLTEYNFPTTLTANERRIVHELCEKFGLLHESQGQDECRFISVKKKIVARPADGQSPTRDQPPSRGKPATSDQSPSMDQPLVDKVSELTVNNKTCAQSDKVYKTISYTSDESKIQNSDSISQISHAGHGKISPAGLGKISPAGHGKKSNVKVSNFTRSTDKKNKGENRATMAVSESEQEAVGGNVRVKVDVDMRQCSACGKDVPAQNYSLHILRCQLVKLKSAELATSANINKVARQKSGKIKSEIKHSKPNRNLTEKGQPGVSCPANKLENVDKDDFDALIAAATKIDTVCNFGKCKEHVTCTGEMCRLCARRYCFKHHIPEVHGCEAAAKSQARRSVIREGVLYAGSGVPDKKPDSATRAHLQRKLEKSLSEKERKRKAKSKT